MNTAIDSAKTVRNTSGKREVLSFRNIHLSPPRSTGANDAKLPGFSLTLLAGELAVFELPPASAMPDISGIACGLTSPPCGEVTYRGEPWSTMDDTDSCARRLTIGQVISSPYRASWIANLDIDENVCLASQIVGTSDFSSIAKRAADLAIGFGLEDGLPGIRESKLPTDKLLRSQWVRAFLPKPLHLIVLERPTLHIPTCHVDQLLDQIASVRAGGTSVVWIGPALTSHEAQKLQPDHHFSPLPDEFHPASS